MKRFRIVRSDEEQAFRDKLARDLWKIHRQSPPMARLLWSIFMRGPELNSEERRRARLNPMIDYAAYIH